MAKRGIRHYHGRQGMDGCLPNATAIFGTKAELHTWAKDEAERWRDEEPEDSGYYLAGNAADGYYWQKRANAADDVSDSDHPEQIFVDRKPCYCDHVWRCDEGTICDEDRCWCCGQKASEATD